MTPRDQRCNLFRPIDRARCIKSRHHRSHCSWDVPEPEMLVADVSDLRRRLSGLVGGPEPDDVFAPDARLTFQNAVVRDLDGKIIGHITHARVTDEGMVEVTMEADLPKEAMFSTKDLRVQ